MSKGPIVGVTSEDGQAVEPPPPDVVEADPDMTPEEAEQARKAYLLTRFWISARGYWSRRGDRAAWPMTIGLVLIIIGIVAFQYGVNVWNRRIFDAIEKNDPDAAAAACRRHISAAAAIAEVVLGDMQDRA